MLNLVGFYLLSTLAVVAGLWLVISRNLLHAVVALAVASLAVAGLMLTLSAEFIAWIVILIYVGAVVVIGVFAVMLTGHFAQPHLPPSNELKLLAGILCLALAGILAGVVLLQPMTAAVTTTALTIKQLGTLLLTDYVLPFELVSVLLLAALIGALVLARGQED